MANLDEDYYQKTGTENDAPDPMVPDKEGFWWYAYDSDPMPVQVVADANGVFYARGFGRIDQHLDKGTWHGPCYKQQEIEDLKETLRKANVMLAGNETIITGLRHEIDFLVKQAVERMGKDYHSVPPLAAQAAPGSTITPDPDTKRRDDHAAFYMKHVALIADAVFLMQEDTGKPAIDAWLKVVEAVYLDVADHFTKHALEDAK